MKIAPPEKPVRRQLGPPQPPVALDDLGVASLVLNAPSTEEAWHILTDRGPVNGAYLVARLVACSSRIDDATAAVAKGLAAIRARRDAGQHVPESWLTRLADLVVEEWDALVSWDDAAAAAAVEPRWVAVPPGDRPIPGDEASPSRIARLFARVYQGVNGLSLSEAQQDAFWARLGSIPAEEGADLDEVKGRCREALRLAISAAYGGGA